MRVEPPASDEVTPGRRHARLAESRQQGTGQQEGGADLAGEILIDLDDGYPRGTEAKAVVGHPANLHPEVFQESDLRFGVADPRYPVQEQLLVGQQACSEDRQGGVLVAGCSQLS